MEQAIKNPPANSGHARDAGSIPGSGRSPEEGNGNPLPRTEKSGGLQSMGSQRVGHNSTHACVYRHTHTHTHTDIGKLSMSMADY